MSHMRPVSQPVIKRDLCRKGNGCIKPCEGGPVVLDLFTDPVVCGSNPSSRIRVDFFSYVGKGIVAYTKPQ